MPSIGAVLRIMKVFLQLTGLTKSATAVGTLSPKYDDEANLLCLSRLSITPSGEILEPTQTAAQFATVDPVGGKPSVAIIADSICWCAYICSCSMAAAAPSRSLRPASGQELVDDEYDDCSLCCLLMFVYISQT